MEQFITYMNHPDDFLQGGITASIQAGSFAGSLLTGAFLADQLGRRKTLLLGSLIFTIGVAISTAANNVKALVAGRVINGIGNGCLAMMVRMRNLKGMQKNTANVSIWENRFLCTKVRSRRLSE